MKYRVVKQLLPKGQSGDPEWSTRTNAYTAVISGRVINFGNLKTKEMHG